MKIKELDILRGVAILLVFGFHVLGFVYGADQLPWDGMIKNFAKPPHGNTFYLFYPLTFGGAGVPVFFVISGFCIHLSYLKNPSWRDFFQKRFYRIFPPYLFFTLLFVVLLNVFDGYQIVTHLLLIHNLDTTTFFGINGAFWSIGVEAQLYALYPLVIFWASRFDWRRTLIITFCFEALFRIIWGIMIFVYQDDLPLNFAVYGLPMMYWWSWGLGAYLAQRYVTGEAITFNNWLIATAVLAGVIFHHVFFLRVLFPFVALATFMLIANIVFKKTVIQENFITRHLAFCGLCSYSFYLLHQPLIMLFERFADDYVHNRVYLMLISLSLWFPLILLSTWSLKFIEKPSIRLGHS